MNVQRKKLGLAVALCLPLWAPFVAGAQSTDSVSEDGTATEKRSQTKTLETITVIADRSDSFSSDYVQVGTFRDARVLDTPLTVSVVTKDLLQAQDAKSIIDAVRNTPGVTQSQINANIYSNISIRGIPVDNLTNYRLNGVLPVINLIDMPMEDKDRIEILKGAGGLFYGFASPSGIVNMVTSRYLGKPLTAVELSVNGHGGYGAHLDVSRKFSKGGSRFNAGAYSLENGVDRSKGDRYFISEAFDWNLSDRLSLQIDGEYIKKTVTEATDMVAPSPVNGVTQVPPAISNRTNVGSPGFLSEGYEYNLLARLNYDISPQWSAAASAGESYLKTTRQYSAFYGYDMQTGDGTLSLALFPDIAHKARIYRGDLSGLVITGPIEHNILAGFSYYTRDNDTPLAQRYLFPQNLYNPVLVPTQPFMPRVRANFSSIDEKAVFLTTRSSYKEWLDVIVGYRKTDYKDVSFTGDYSVKPDTWSYGLMVKPTEKLSAYWNYIEALESGGIVPQIATNGGQTMPARTSEQTEFGIKYEPKNGLLLTAAHFDIDRASAYLNSANLFVQDGIASYKGFEVSLSGELTEHLSIYLGAMSLDAVQASGSSAVVGKRIENTPKRSGSVFLEYRIPTIEGLSVSAGAFYTGERAINATNTGFVPAYTTFDMGASYETKVNKRDLAFRLYVSNVADKDYWAATGASLLQQGAPRTISLTVSTSF